MAEKLQAQLAAEEEGSYYVSTLGQRCEESVVQLIKMMDENTRLAEENSRLHGQMCCAEKVQAENVDLKRQLMRVAEERNSVIQAINCLATQLEDTECKLKATREMAESALTEVKRDQREAVQLFRAQVSELDNQFQSPSKSAWAEDSPGSCLLLEEDPASETEGSVADKQVVILQALGQQLGKLQTCTA